MAKVTYIENGGTEHHVDVPNGLSVMDGAKRFTIPGIEGDCGGAGACATCHVYVEPEFMDAVGGVNDLEDDMLDGAESERLDNSRLSCQIKMNADLDGLRVRVAPRQ